MTNHIQHKSGWCAGSGVDALGSGVGAFGFPLVDWVLIEVVAAVFAFFLGAALFLLLAFFAAVTHGVSPDNILEAMRG
jgi:hypothetical protein